jgi:hypothetical protein
MLCNIEKLLIFPSIDLWALVIKGSRLEVIQFARLIYSIPPETQIPIVFKGVVAKTIGRQAWSIWIYARQAEILLVIKESPKIYIQA